jgi:YVTN family beta-propeller protein
MLRKAAALFIVCASIAPWIGCGSTKSAYLYATLPTSNEFVAFREDPNSGVLTGLSFSPITAGPGVDAVVVHPSKKFLYATNSGQVPQGDVSQFAIASDGVLSQVGQNATAGTDPSLLAIDSTGSYLYVGNSGSNDISVFSIDASTGALSAVAGSPFQLGLPPINLKLSPSGGTLYVTGAGSPQGYIEVLSVNPGSSSQPFLSFVQLAFAGANPYGLTVSPGGAYLYTANTGDNSISGFAIATDGTLSLISGFPLGGNLTSPVALLIDNSGKFLFVANQGSSNVGVYAIGSNGGLAPLTNSPFATGSHPISLATDPTGHFLFVGNQTSPAIESFSLNTSSGTLTPVGTYSVGNTPTSIAISQ